MPCAALSSPCDRLQPHVARLCRDVQTRSEKLYYPATILGRFDLGPDRFQIALPTSPIGTLRRIHSSEALYRLGVTTVYLTHDCGQIINPGGLKNQLDVTCCKP